MATVIVDFTGFPQAVAVNGTQLTALNDGKWRATFTFTNASSNGAWGGGGFFALTACNDLGGCWIYDDSGTRKIALFEDASGSPLIVETPLTWGAGASVTVVVDNVADTITISGATTGNGTFAFTGSSTGNVFGTSPIGGGAYGGGGFGWAGSMSDIDDGNDGTQFERSAAMAGAVDLEIAGRRQHNRAAAAAAAADLEVAGRHTHNRAAALAAAAALAIAGQVTGGATTHERSAAMSAAADLEVAGRRTHQRSAAASAAVDLEATGQRSHQRTATMTAVANLEIAGSVAGSGFGIDVYGSDRALYGAPAGTVDVTLNTPASGSTILVCVGGNLSDLADPPTDTNANTWTLVGQEEFALWSGYGIRVYKCVGATGGTSHTFTQEFGQTLGFDEASIVVCVVRQASHIEAEVLVERASGSSLVTPSVTSQAAAAWIVFLSGDATTGATTALTPSNGLVVLDDATGIDHPNGYVPIVLLGKEESTPGALTSTIGIVPTQGAIIAAFVVQEARVIGRSASMSAAVNLEVAGQRTANRSAALAASADLEVAGRKIANRSAAVAAAVNVEIAGQVVRQRSAALTGAVDLEVAGVPTRQRSASLAAAVDVELVGVPTRQRSAALALAADIAIAALRTHQRTAAIAAAVDLEIAGLALPPGAVQHERAAALSAAFAVAASGQVVRQRSASVEGAASLVIVGQRSHQRAAALAGAVNLEIAGSTSATILPRTFTVTLGIPAADDFTVEVIP